MNIALVTNSVVTNVIVAESLQFIQDNADSWPSDVAVDITDTQVGIGDTYVDGVFAKPVLIPVIPDVIPNQTIFTTNEFLVWIGDDIDARTASTDPLVKTIVERFRLRDHEVDVESDKFDEVMAAAILADDISQERADELKLGKVSV